MLNITTQNVINFNEPPLIIYKNYYNMLIL